MIRQRAPADYAALKTGWKLLVQTLGGVDAVAACTRATRSLASEYGAVHSERFPPLDVLLDAETIAGTPHCLAVLARLTGHELVPVLPRHAGVLASELQHVAGSSAELFRDAAAALAHDRLGEAERAQLQADLARLIHAARQAAAALAANAPARAERSVARAERSAGAARPPAASTRGKNHAAR